MLGKQGSLKSAYAVFRLPDLFRLPQLFRLPENRLAVAIRCVYNAHPLQGSLKIRFVTKERP